MQITRFTGDKIEQMIKKKIMITNGIQFNRSKAYSSTHYRTKSSNKQRIPVQKKPKNDIVIMNMPPSNHVENDIYPFLKKFNNKNPHENRTPIFTNPQISSQIERFQSYMFCESNLNKQNLHNNNANDVLELKRYNSLNIRFSNDGLRRKLSKNIESSQSQGKGLINDNLILNHKSSVHCIEFKPSFRQLLKRNTKVPSKMQIKLKKSEFNYQRAISTSSESRKKAFQKILNAFEENCLRKFHQNPQIVKPKAELEMGNLTERVKFSRQLQSRAKTSQKSPQNKERKQKEQEPCRPWSAGKRNLIKLQQTEDQNPLQFYSINAKY